MVGLWFVVGSEPHVKSWVPCEIRIAVRALQQVLAEFFRFSSAIHYSTVAP